MSIRDYLTNTLEQFAIGSQDHCHECGGAKVLEDAESDPTVMIIRGKTVTVYDTVPCDTCEGTGVVEVDAGDRHYFALSMAIGCMNAAKEGEDYESVYEALAWAMDFMMVSAAASGVTMKDIEDAGEKIFGTALDNTSEGDGNIGALTAEEISDLERE